MYLEYDMVVISLSLYNCHYGKIYREKGYFILAINVFILDYILSFLLYI